MQCLPQNWFGCEFFTCVHDERRTIWANGTRARECPIDVIPVITSNSPIQVEPVNEIFGDSVAPSDVSPSCPANIVLVEKMVVTLVEEESCKQNNKTQPA